MHLRIRRVIYRIIILSYHHFVESFRSDGRKEDKVMRDRMIKDKVAKLAVLRQTLG